MTLIVDSREKWTQPGSTDRHIPDYFDRHGIEWEVRKLDVGDYQIEGNPSVSVDRKHSIEELSRNLMNKADSSRFWREVRRSFAQGTKLIVLCECGGKYKTVNDLQTWRSKYSGVSGIKLIHEIVRCEYAYGTVFKLCDKRSTARLIIELLTEYESDNKGKDDNAETKTTISNSGGDATDRTGDSQVDV